MAKESPLNMAHFFQRQAEKSLHENQFDKAFLLYKKSKDFLCHALSQQKDLYLRNMIEVQVVDVDRQLFLVQLHKQKHLDSVILAGHENVQLKAHSKKQTIFTPALASEIHPPDTLLFAGTGHSTNEMVESNYLSAHKVPKSEASVNEELLISNASLRDTLIQFIMENEALHKENERLQEENKRLKMRCCVCVITAAETASDSNDADVSHCAPQSTLNHFPSLLSSSFQHELSQAAEDLDLPPLDLPDIDFDSLKVDN